MNPCAGGKPSQKFFYDASTHRIKQTTSSGQVLCLDVVEDTGDETDSINGMVFLNENCDGSAYYIYNQVRFVE